MQHGDFPISYVNVYRRVFASHAGWQPFPAGSNPPGAPDVFPHVRGQGGAPTGEQLLFYGDLTKYLGKFHHDHDRTLFSLTITYYNHSYYKGNHPHSWPQDSG